MMANYGVQPNGFNNGIAGGPAAQVSKPTTDYSNWINPNQAQPQTQQMPPQSEQRGITVSYMVQSRAEYASIYPPAGQTVAIFNFPDHELCLKAKDMWGIDLGIRTFDLTETTQMIPVQNNSNQNQQTQTEPTVSKAEFDALQEKFNTLYKELKG